MKEQYYIAQKYSESDEYHLYEIKWIRVDTGLEWRLVDNESLCSQVEYDEDEYHSFPRPLSPQSTCEDAMAVTCAQKKWNVRHAICAKCVGRFYKT